MTLYKRINGEQVALTPEEEQAFLAGQISNEELFQIAKRDKCEICKDYLSKTDWYINREADELNSYPQVIKDKRIFARNSINAIELLTTIEEVEAFDINQIIT